MKRGHLGDRQRRARASPRPPGASHDWAETIAGAVVLVAVGLGATAVVAVGWAGAFWAAVDCATELTTWAAVVAAGAALAGRGTAMVSPPMAITLSLIHIR